MLPLWMDTAESRVIKITRIMADYGLQFSHYLRVLTQNKALKGQS